MRLGPILGSTTTVIFIILFQWPKLTSNQKKEKAAFLILTGMGWLLINFLFIFPNTPGPTEVIEFLYKPLGKLLE